MKWLVQDTSKSDIDLLAAIERLNLPVEFLTAKDLYTKDLTTEEPVAIHASTWGVKHLEQTYGFKTFTPFEDLRCQKYYAYWGGPRMFNQEYVLLPLSEAVRTFDFYMKAFDSNGLFVRPDTNDKSFSGQVYVDGADLEGLLNALPPETLVLMAKAYDIDAEWRMVVCNQKVVSGSLYKVKGKLQKERNLEPQGFAETFEPYPGLPPIYVMDIAASCGKYFLMEIGSVNCAGFYDCDLDAIVQAVTQETALMYARKNFVAEANVIMDFKYGNR